VQNNAPDGYKSTIIAVDNVAAVTGGVSLRALSGAVARWRGRALAPTWRDAEADDESAPTSPCRDARERLKSNPRSADEYSIPGNRDLGTRVVIASSLSLSLKKRR